MNSFNDRQLENLIKLAVEAEELERSADLPALRLVGVARPAQRKWLLPLAGLMAAAAAGVAVTTVVLPMIRPTSQPMPVAVEPRGTSHLVAPVESSRDKTRHALASLGNSPVKSSDFENPLNPNGQPVTGPEESSVVLAFFQGIDGSCSCMHIQKEEWDAAQLTGKGRDALLNLAFQSSCTQPSSKVLVVGISAPTNSLPTTQEAAQALADRLSDAFNGARVDLVSRAYEAMPQLPAGSTVVAESFGHGRSFPVEPAKWPMR
jgi:hypothetical protein